MTKREIRKRIYLSSDKRNGYYVRNAMYDTLFNPFSCSCGNIKIGNAIVRTLREIAYKEHGHG